MKKTQGKIHMGLSLTLSVSIKTFLTVKNYQRRVSVLKFIASKMFKNKMLVGYKMLPNIINSG